MQNTQCMTAHLSSLLLPTFPLSLRQQGRDLLLIVLQLPACLCDAVVVEILRLKALQDLLRHRYYDCVNYGYAT
jgi:hypothetical protein